MKSKKIYRALLLLKVFILLTINIYAYKMLLVYFVGETTYVFIMTASISLFFIAIIFIDIIRGHDRSVSVFDRVSYFLFCLSHISYIASAMFKIKFAMPVENIPVLDDELKSTFDVTNSRELIELYASVCMTKECIEAYVIDKYPGFIVPMINQSKMIESFQHNYFLLKKL